MDSYLLSSLGVRSPFSGVGQCLLVHVALPDDSLSLLSPSFLRKIGHQDIHRYVCKLCFLPFYGVCKTVVMLWIGPCVLYCKRWIESLASQRPCSGQRGGHPMIASQCKFLGTTTNMAQDSLIIWKFQPLPHRLYICHLQRNQASWQQIRTLDCH
jgi:hypothetical protein